jgi:hypothetical protein
MIATTHLLNGHHRIELVQLCIELAEGVDVSLVLRSKLQRHACGSGSMQPWGHSQANYSP